MPEGKEILRGRPQQDLSPDQILRQSEGRPGDGDHPHESVPNIKWPDGHPCPVPRVPGCDWTRLPWKGMQCGNRTLRTRAAPSEITLIPNDHLRGRARTRSCPGTQSYIEEGQQAYDLTEGQAAGIVGCEVQGIVSSCQGTPSIAAFNKCRPEEGK